MECYELKKNEMSGLFLLIFFTVFFYSSTFSDRLLFKAIGWIWAILFGLILLLTVYRWLFQKGPAVIINEKGILTTQSIFKLIPWDDIESVRRSVRLSQFLEINVPNRKNYLKGIRGCLDSFLNSNCTIVYIPFAMLSPNLDEVLEYIQKNYHDKILKE